MTRAKPLYEYNQIQRSLDGTRYYFVPKARVLGGGVLRALGKKYDVTEGVQLILEQDRRRATARRRAKRKKA